MKFVLNAWELNGLKRPVGPLGVASTRMMGPDVLLARLSGLSKKGVAVVRHKKKYFFVAPPALGGTVEVPADSLTDALHWSVTVLGEELRETRGGPVK